MPKRNIIWVLVVLAVFTYALKADSPAVRTQRTYFEEFEKLAIVLHQIKERYVADVDEQALFEGAARGMVAELDPYCTYVPPRLENEFSKDVQGRFGGIGIKIGMRNGILTVISPLEGTPAIRAGVLAGDSILKINGQSTDGIALDEAVERLTGEPGTAVTITVVHEGESTSVDITMTRAQIVVPTVAGVQRLKDGHWDFMTDKNAHIGYVRLISFTKDTLPALDKTVEDLRRQGLRGLVLDLRFNPGGLLSSAVDVASRFIAKGVIVSTRGRDPGSVEQEVARGEGTYEAFPVVVLINRYSASAAEIVAGALQDHHRAVLVGERTFGKGSVQSVIELGSGRGTLKITTAEYYLPSGRSISRAEQTGRAVKEPAKPERPKDGTKAEPTWGVHPDIEVPFTDQENRQLLLLRRDADVIRTESQPATHPAMPTAPSASGAPAVPAAPFVDRQLERAIDVLKAWEVWNAPARTAPPRPAGESARTGLPRGAPGSAEL
jgi:carboxyl-terminal processing protease